MLRHEAEARGILGRGLAVSDSVARTMILAEWRADCRNDPDLLTHLQQVLLGVGSISRVVPAQTLYEETLLDAAMKGRR